RQIASMPASPARNNPGAAARFETTMAIVAASRRAAVASTSACRLLPRPEMSTPRRRSAKGGRTLVSRDIKAQPQRSRTQTDGTVRKIRDHLATVERVGENRRTRTNEAREDERSKT